MNNTSFTALTSDRKLLTILFADIVGYTRMMHEDEIRALELLDQFKLITSETIAKSKGRIWLFYGDGCLATFETATAGVDCAMKLQQSYSSISSLGVRLGLHLGEVVVGEDNIHGDHVNIASRIESMGVPMGVLMSVAVANQIKNKPIYLLASLGLFDFKNIEEPIEVLAVANEGFRVPDPSKLQGKFDEEKIKQRKWRKLWIRAGLAGVIAVSLFFLIPSLSNKKRAGGEPITTLAVFPFTDLSSDGIYGEYAKLIGMAVYEKLANINDIKLISLSGLLRESNVDFPAEMRSMVQLDRYVSGNILPIDNTVTNIQGELVEPSSHEVLWVSSFEHHQGQELLTVVNQLTGMILDKIGVDVPGQKQGQFERVETESTKAFSLVMEAVRLAEFRQIDSLNKSLAMLDMAISLDENYAEAYAEKANVVAAQGWSRFGDRKTLFTEAESLAHKAIDLYPEVETAPSVLAAIAEFNQDKVRARELYLRALKLVPNDPNAHRHYSLFLKRSRRYQEALGYAQTATEIGPGSILNNRNYLDLLISLNLLDRANAFLDTIERRIPDQMHRFADLQGDILSRNGKYTESIPYYEEGIKLKTSVCGQLGYCYGRNGQLKEAGDMLTLADNTSYPSVNKAMIFVGMAYTSGIYRDSAYKYIDRAIQENSGVNFLCDHPFFESVQIPVCDK